MRDQVVFESQGQVRDVLKAVADMAALPLEAIVLTMTLMATQMPFVGRG